MGLEVFFSENCEELTNPLSLRQLPFAKGEPYRENLFLLERIKALIYRKKVT